LVGISVHDDPFYQHISTTVISGIAQKYGTIVSVQLVVGALDLRRQCLTESTAQFQSVLRSIFRFYGSHVQCFLAGHAALHMYYQLAAERKSYFWQVPEIIRGRANAAVQSIRSEAFSF
jgi:hypothetical protein